MHMGTEKGGKIFLSYLYDVFLKLLLTFYIDVGEICGFDARVENFEACDSLVLTRDNLVSTRDILQGDNLAFAKA